VGGIIKELFNHDHSMANFHINRSRVTTTIIFFEKSLSFNEVNLKIVVEE
jgi:hypothetical protein